ncbi:MAG TPA: hypothetical protein PLY38_02740 [Candidatus Hydrothermia bacterium]|nr:hypothetical protein [Candidatus Hydrothermae bacterium]MDD3649246.1 hypothetical protein [Candidatus Hydrothermia bacterium]MDD5573079.1 hypothetical protein [Candidatus Hydrothermia bacterium]HPO78447.1 hypothetical protein [Candidatus Hydrothermia bacterium]HRD22749.1 hypothetical protein [Candidatus Hydrothermia bacterium]
MTTLIYILVSIALIVLICVFVYLFIILLQLNQSLRKFNTLLDSANAQLPEIMENIRIVTLKAKLISSNAEKGFKQLSRAASFLFPFPSFLKMFRGLFRKNKEEKNE